MARKQSNTPLRSAAPPLPAPAEDIPHVDESEMPDTIADPLVGEDTIESAWIEETLTLVERPAWSVTIGVKTGSVHLKYGYQSLLLGHIDMDMTTLTETQMRQHASFMFQKFYQDLRS